MTTPKKTSEQLAEEHWNWQRRFLKEVAEVSDTNLKKIGRVAIDYFIHGYKHGKDSKK